MWSSRSRTPDGPTELDRKLVGLLLAGLTDPAAATQLNLSVRTLQRRLRRLMDLAGAERGCSSAGTPPETAGAEVR